jgi:PAS domain-containing protein
MISLDDYSELLAVLYSLPLHPDRWGRFLDLLCQCTGSNSSFLICANSRATLSIQERGGAAWDPNVIESYATRYAQRDPFRLPLVQAGRTGVLDCSDLLSDDVMVQSEMYQHLNRPCGVRYPGLMVLTLSLRRLEVISFWRTAEEGPIDEDSKRLLRLLFPHVRSVVEIQNALGVAARRLAGAEAVADASMTATLLLTENGEIVHCNAAGESLLAKGDGLMVDNGRVVAAEGSMRTTLRCFLANASGFQPFSNNVGPTSALSLKRTNNDECLQLLATPAPGVHEDGKPCVLLVVGDRERQVDFTDDILQAYYGITPAETEVANGLLTGYSLEEIAALRKVSVGTVRFQLYATEQHTCKRDSVCDELWS